MIGFNSPKKVTPNREVESDNIYFLMLGIHFLMLGIYFLMLSIHFLMIGKRDYSATQTTTRFSSFELKG